MEVLEYIRYLFDPENLETQNHNFVVPRNMALVRKPETYNGADPEGFGEWFDRFKLIATANGWDEAKQLVIIPTLLTHHAFRVFNDLEGPKKDSMNNIKTKPYKRVMIFFNILKISINVISRKNILFQKNFKIIYLL